VTDGTTTFRNVRVWGSVRDGVPLEVPASIPKAVPNTVPIRVPKTIPRVVPKAVVSKMSRFPALTCGDNGLPRADISFCTPLADRPTRCPPEESGGRRRPVGGVTARGAHHADRARYLLTGWAVKGAPRAPARPGGGAAAPPPPVSSPPDPGGGPAMPTASTRPPPDRGSGDLGTRTRSE